MCLDDIGVSGLSQAGQQTELVVLTCSGGAKPAALSKADPVGEGEVGQVQLSLHLASLAGVAARRFD
jgi:hypothetical protein